MKCTECNSEMVCDKQTMSNPPKNIWECPICGQKVYENINKIIPKEKIKIDTSKIKSFEDVALIFEMLGGLYISSDYPDIEKIRHLF